MRHSRLSPDERRLNMKVRLQMMVQDPRFAPIAGARRRVEGYDISGVAFADGPACERVRVVDLDAFTGQVAPPVRFVAPGARRRLGRFDLPRPAEIDVESRTFNQVSVMATVLKTIDLYEDPDVLGRPVRWAFPEPQLTVIPRFRQAENAQYVRGSKRLEFFFFPSHVNPAETVYTSLSRDIVAHETGHAILDGIAPHLLDASTRTPQSLALHEAIGDITGLLIAISSPSLRQEVLAKTHGSIDKANAFSAVGEQFGMARGAGALRDLLNDRTMGNVDHAEPHELSKVLTGALYTVLVKMHRKRWQAACLPTDTAQQRYSKSGKALWESSEQFKRMALRALDYLPPGRIIFADYARAIIAADQVSHPDDPEEREWLCDEFVRRGIVSTPAALNVPVPMADLGAVDLDALLVNDVVAQGFAEAHRNLLQIPAGRPFTVGPRLKVTKRYYHRPAEAADTVAPEVSELLLKVWWSEPAGSTQLVGTTLATDWATQRPRVLLTSDRRSRPQEAQALQTDLDLPGVHAASIACCR
jgi:hypothetical protein